MLLTDIARNMAFKQGWYQQRQTLQIFVSFSIAAIGTILIAITGWIMRRDRNCLLTVTGLILLLTFLVIRAASLHYIDHLLAIKFAGQKLRCLLELAAIVFIAISAAISAKSK